MTHGLSAVHALDGGGVTKSKKLVASFYDIYLLGITIVVAGQLCVWNTAVAQFADLFPAMTGIDKAYSPIIWLVFYSIALPFSIQGGSWFFRFSNFIAIYLMLLIFVYFFGVVSEGNLPKYATGMVGGGMDFMKYYSSTLWFYVGVEALTLTCDEIKDPSLANREKVPSSVGIANHLSPEHEKNSMIMDTSPPLPLQLSRVGLDPRENMMVPILGKCNSSEQAMGGVPRLRVDTVDMLESEVRYPSSTTQQLSRRS
eukprot:gene3076-3359_t